MVQGIVRFLKGLLKTLIYSVIGLVVIALALFFFVVTFIEFENPQIVAPQEIKWVEIGDNKIAYQHVPADSDKSVVLVGGTGAWSGVWQKTIDDLKGEYTVYAIDLPPFGFSVIDEQYTYTLENQADMINGVLHALELSDVLLVAHSYGAGPAMEAVLNEQENYQAFVIIDGVIHIDQEEQQTPVVLDYFAGVPLLRHLVVSLALHFPGFIKTALQYSVHDTDAVNNFWVSVYSHPLHVENQSKNIAEWLYDFVYQQEEGLSGKSTNYENYSVPTTILWGSEDTLTPLEQGKSLQALLPGSDLIVLDDVGHIPMIENHEQYIRALRESISGF